MPPVTVPSDRRAFEVVAPFEPAGDQPKAIEALAAGVAEGHPFQTLLGITGSGKSATIAWTIERAQRPTLVLAPNKSLAAQLANELRELFPHNRVEYFVSYYDYYQPEAYMPASDTYIEKDASINDEIERLRHSTTSALLTRRDVVVVASVSCIYGLGGPEEYQNQLLVLRTGESYDHRAILRRLVDMHYERNDIDLARGRFRVRGDTLEVRLVDGDDGAVLLVGAVVRLHVDELSRREHRADPGQRACFARVDPCDAGVGKRARHELAERHAGNLEVSGELRAPRELVVRVDPAHRRANRLEFARGHRPASAASWTASTIFL